MLKKVLHLDSEKFFKVILLKFVLYRFVKANSSNLDKILLILRKNKYFTSAKDTLVKRARQLETIAYMKKEFTYKDLWYNIELNVKELSTSRILSHKFLLGRLSPRFLLINHEKFCERKDKILKKLLKNYKPKEGKLNLSEQGRKL